MICDKCTSIVLPFSESKMFPRKRRKRERKRKRQMEDRELENICKSSIYSRIEKDARFNFPGGNLPVEEGIRRVSTRQFAVLIEADAALMKRSNRVFRLKNGPLEMKSSVAEGCFLRSRHSINSLFLFFSQRVTLSQGSRMLFFDYARFLNPFFDTSPIFLRLFSLSKVSLFHGSYSSLHAGDKVHSFLLEQTDYPIETTMVWFLK